MIATELTEEKLSVQELRDVYHNIELYQKERIRYQEVSDKLRTAAPLYKVRFTHYSKDGEFAEKYIVIRKEHVPFEDTLTKGIHLTEYLHRFVQELVLPLHAVDSKEYELFVLPYRQKNNYRKVYFSMYLKEVIQENTHSFIMVEIDSNRALCIHVKTK